MRELLQIIIFPFFVLYSIIQALVAKPLHFSYSKNRGLEIGIVPFIVMQIVIYELIQFVL
jgi:hypothetical protein